MTTSLGREHLQSFIDTHRLKATILPMAVPTATVTDAAGALGVAPSAIIKSLVFLAEDRPFLVVNSGTARVDRKKLADYLGMNRRRVKFATAEQALEITGYVVGSMPPFGHREPLRTLLDRTAARRKDMYGGGGEIDALVKVSSEELIAVTQAEIADVSEM
ncbi:YbaK/EbsC family protein [uncultured Desulfosarcina sp.]|uniref:aminoacyl-tRNA deacylase n=1 Tax=uncultured Desulfosarcina sp. TaxID=218289 RepID=UPI0029C870E2|nr:YbaK/EbsC family protein [uncultured Desulfosarcina sp.]